MTYAQLASLGDEIAAEMTARMQTLVEVNRCQECGVELGDWFDNCCPCCREWLIENLNADVRTPNPDLAPTRLMEVAT